MTMILKMSDCDAKGFVQMQKLQMLKCKDQCSNNIVVTFNHNQLQSQVDKLQMPTSRDLMAETFADMFEGADSDDSMQFVRWTSCRCRHPGTSWQKPLQTCLKELTQTIQCSSSGGQVADADIQGPHGRNLCRHV